MAWIKRNLYFVIGSLVAVALMGVGGFLLFSQISQESQVTENIKAKYAELDALNKANPHPGNEKIENIKAAKEQEQTLRAYTAKTRPYFQRVAPIPDTKPVINSDFAAELRNTIVQLHHEAELQSVVLPKDYYFTFEAQKKQMIFEAGSLDKLAMHLGEIKAICEILFNARVNALDSVRRESVSQSDNNPPDYLSQKTTSTPLAELTPYELTFRCFSSELAQVLGGLAASPNGFLG